MDYQNPRKTLTSEQKTGFVLLLIFGILAVGLGVLQIRNNIFSPFIVKINKDRQDINKLFVDEDSRLQSIDTDQDGLNDYEELNFYETSPYLPDTDSDEILDKQEIENGTDPNCPEGESCGLSETVILPSSTLDISGVSSTLSNDFLLNESENLDNLERNIKILSENPNKLRELILLSGTLNEEQLSKIDDNSLLSLFKDALLEQGGSQYLKNFGENTTSSDFVFPLSASAVKAND